MKISGEYSLRYNIFTMFNVYSVNIKNHNLITDKGYEFFLKKWYKHEDYYPIQLGYYHENEFYMDFANDDTYFNKMTPQQNLIYVDKTNNKQYLYDGEKYIDFYEKLNKICIGKCDSTSNDGMVDVHPSKNDKELYLPLNEYDISDYQIDNGKLLLKCEISSNELDKTTEIGVKTNRGILVSHDIHKPYSLPFDTNIILEYVFNLKNEE